MEDILRQNGIDTSQFKLGTLCKRSHDWNGTGLSLRRNRPGGGCVECQNLTQGAKKAERGGRLKVNTPPEMVSVLIQNGLDPEIYGLSSLCSRGHGWLNTGMTLRMHKNGQCRECRAERQIERRKSAPRNKDDDPILLAAGLDPAGVFLGHLCPRGHDWNGTGRTLRYRASLDCPLCQGKKRIGLHHRTPEGAFWSRVDIRGKDECWEWSGYKNDKGYGIIYYKGDQRTTHRLSYDLTHGGIPDGLGVLHHCDNPPCCNPNHLYAGTPRDNVNDMLERGRFPMGSKSGTAKLTEDQVRDIRVLISQKISDSEIGRRYNVTHQTIRHIRLGDTWASVV